MLLPDKHKSIITQQAVLLKSIYEHFVINELLSAADQYCAVTLFHYLEEINVICSRFALSYASLQFQFRCYWFLIDLEMAL